MKPFFMVIIACSAILFMQSFKHKKVQRTIAGKKKLLPLAKDTIVHSAILFDEHITRHMLW
jgi:hypothetical protein